MKTNLGENAFLAGVAIAILIGLFNVTESWVTVVLVILGIIVGLLNITTKETMPFLTSSIALLVVGSAGLERLPVVGSLVKSVLTSIVTFVAPAAVIIALKTVFDIAKKK
jgi:uncharacterized membrane protein